MLTPAEQAEKFYNDRIKDAYRKAIGQFELEIRVKFPGHPDISRARNEAIKKLNEELDESKS